MGSLIHSLRPSSNHHSFNHNPRGSTAQLPLMGSRHFHLHSNIHSPDFSHLRSKLAPNPSRVGRRGLSVPILPRLSIESKLHRKVCSQLKDRTAYLPHLDYHSGPASTRPMSMQSKCSRCIKVSCLALQMFHITRRPHRFQRRRRMERLRLQHRKRSFRQSLRRPRSPRASKVDSRRKRNRRRIRTSPSNLCGQMMRSVRRRRWPASPGTLSTPRIESRLSWGRSKLQ